MLIELHILQNHAPSNLNRDDTGSPKEAFFGGYRRARISSQCLKRSIRKSSLFKEELGEALAFRTKRIAEQVKKVLQGELGATAEEAERIARKAAVLGSAEKQDEEAAQAAAAPAGGSDPATPARSTRRRSGRATGTGSQSVAGLTETKQLIFTDSKEVRAIAKALHDIATEKAGDFESMGAAELEKAVADKVKPAEGQSRHVPAEVALFGRMTTSPAFEDVNAAVQVAHAISTNKLDPEFDYYTAVDDLKDARAGDDAGAGMVGDVEFNSSCFYKYFSIDWDAFRGMVGDDVLATAALRGLVRATVLTTPTGKQNGFAAHNPPDLVLVECKTRKIPLSYANAFVEPSTPRGKRDLVEDSMVRLASYAGGITRAYSIQAERFWLSPRDAKALSKEETAALGKRVNTLDDLIQRLCTQCPGAIQAEGQP
jgi:CRISPR system Cascade subunit CasC